MEQYDDNFEEFESELPDNLEELIGETFKVGNITITIPYENRERYLALGVYHDSMRIIGNLLAEKLNCEENVATYMDEGNYHKVSTLAARVAELEDQLEFMTETNDKLRSLLRQLCWME